MYKRAYGFVLIELVVVLGIIATLFSIGYVRLTAVERRAPLGATVNTVIADLRGQQTKAMTGATQGGAVGDSYGIYFQANAYTLFKGTTFAGGDPANATFSLPTNITFSSIALPASSVAFTKGSGDVAGYSTTSNTVTLTQGLTGEYKTITINRYGAVVSVQ